MIKRYEYFEDYDLGQTGVTRTRTVGEPEIANFGCITCDYAYVHLAHHSTVNGPYGGRVAHGLLGTSLVVGLLSLDAPHLVGRGVPAGYLYAFDANYRDAIRLGETIRIAWKIADKIDEQDHRSYGMIKSEFHILTQEDKEVYDGTLLLKVPRRASGKEIVNPLDTEPPAPWAFKEFPLEPERIYYLEDFKVGEGGATSGRTITETDIVNFAGLTGDYNPLYVDDHYAKTSPFQGRIVPGLLAFTMAFGLWNRDSGVMRARSSESANDAGHLNDSSVFHQPVRIGDTIHCIYRIEETRVSRSKPQLGIIKYGFQILNQRDEVVQEGKTLMMRETSKAM
jgi:acyl dehydratase